MDSITYHVLLLIFIWIILCKTAVIESSIISIFTHHLWIKLSLLSLEISFTVSLKLRKILWMKVCQTLIRIFSIFENGLLSSYQLRLSLSLSHTYIHTFFPDFLEGVSLWCNGKKQWTVGSSLASSYFSCAITFTFRQISLGKVWTPLSSQLCVK